MLNCSIRAGKFEEKRHVSETAAATNLQRRMRRSTLTFFILFIAVIAFVLPNSLLSIIIGVVARLLGDELHPVLYVLQFCRDVYSLHSRSYHHYAKSGREGDFNLPEEISCSEMAELSSTERASQPTSVTKATIVRSGGSLSAGGTSMARLVHVDIHNPPTEVIPLRASDHILPTEPPPLVEAPDSSVAGRDSPPETSSLPTETPQPVEASDSSVARQDSPPETSSSPTETPPQWKHLIHQWKDKIHVSRNPCNLPTEAPPLVEFGTTFTT
jgi:hypothetical protein